MKTEQIGEKLTYKYTVTKTYKDCTSKITVDSHDKEPDVESIKNEVVEFSAKNGHDLVSVKVKVTKKVMPVFAAYTPCGQGFGGMYA